MLSTLVVSFLLATSSVFAGPAHLHPHGKRADLSVAPVTATATQVVLDVSSTGAGLKLLTTQAAAVQSTGVAGLDITAILESMVGTDAAALASASAYAASYVAGGGDLASLLGGTATALATATPAASSASEPVASALNYPGSVASSGSASSSVNAAGLVLSSAAASASASSSLTGSAHHSWTQDGGFLALAASGALAVSLVLL
ncbi:hypothetical protein BDY24DRAFT_378579 [Mrakia frigida]|uniref:uncharacterized protein n=1 Tax=Mrakia frigida TaxID=29902 RepID=UPI003FCC2542